MQHIAVPLLAQLVKLICFGRLRLWVPLGFISTDCHKMPQNLKDCHGLPQTATEYHRLPQTFIDFIDHSSTVQKIQKSSESPGTAHMVAKLCVTNCRAAGVVAAGLQGNGERMRKWTENEEMERE